MGSVVPLKSSAASEGEVAPMLSGWVWMVFRHGAMALASIDGKHFARRRRAQELEDVRLFGVHRRIGHDVPEHRPRQNGGR